MPLNDDALRVLAGQRGKHRRWVFPVPRWVPAEREGDKPRQVADSPTGKVSNHAWRKACTRAGVPTLRFHDLRHTWASWHVQSGTPLAVLQELGGWASLAAATWRSGPATCGPAAHFRHNRHNGRRPRKRRRPRKGRRINKMRWGG